MAFHYDAPDETDGVLNIPGTQNRSYSLDDPKSPEKKEFGDFQTPRGLALDICRLLSRRGIKPKAIVEPNCGVGNILMAALERFARASTVVGLEVNREYVAELRGRLQQHSQAAKVQLRGDSFFAADWDIVLQGLPEPLLVVGNPPWVTSAELGALGSSNLPEKSNFQKHVGLDAITGKSNFDISEWMLLRELDWLDGRRGYLAMLCKTMVARKVLLQAWARELQLTNAAMYLIDAKKHFDAAVDACLLVCSFAPNGRSTVADVYANLNAREANRQLGYRDGHLIADVEAWERSKHLAAVGASPYTWRSGVKHDCAKVMEFHEQAAGLANKLGETVAIETDYLYPMLKGAQVAKVNGVRPKQWMLVPQQSAGEDTSLIAERAPRTWDYLKRHGELLDRRRSSIYRNRPRFSVFGLGDYTFAPWKVAIAGLYKHLRFRVVGKHRSKPVVLDDTCYFLACNTKAEAELICSLLNSPAAQDFYSAFVFWDSKRPVTVDLLSRLDLRKLADKNGQGETFDNFARKRAAGRPKPVRHRFAASTLASTSK